MIYRTDDEYTAQLLNQIESLKKENKLLEEKCTKSMELLCLVLKGSPKELIIDFLNKNQ